MKKLILGFLVMMIFNSVSYAANLTIDNDTNNKTESTFKEGPISEKINFNIEGEITAGTCLVVNGESKTHVDLGGHAVPTIDKNSPVYKSSAIFYDLVLNCPMAGIKATAILEGNKADPNDDFVIALDKDSAATNVGVMVNVFQGPDESKWLSVVFSGAGTNIFPVSQGEVSIEGKNKIRLRSFYKQIIQGQPIGQGTANASVTLVFRYE